MHWETIGVVTLLCLVAAYVFYIYWEMKKKEGKEEEREKGKILSRAYPRDEGVESGEKWRKMAGGVNKGKNPGIMDIEISEKGSSSMFSPLDTLDPSLSSLLWTDPPLEEPCDLPEASVFLDSLSWEETLALGLHGDLPDPAPDPIYNGGMSSRKVDADLWDLYAEYQGVRDNDWYFREGHHLE